MQPAGCPAAPCVAHRRCLHRRQRQCNSLQQRTAKQQQRGTGSAWCSAQASFTEQHPPVSSSRPAARSSDQLHSGQSNQIAAAPKARSSAKNGVLLLNLGGPESLADVRPFLYNLFADPDIIRLPAALKFLQPVLANVISTLRSPKSSEGYAAIGGGSPLR